MTKLLSSLNFSEVGLLKSLLEAEDVACVIRNEHLSSLAGEVPFFECYPELWVLNDADYATAQELLAKGQNPQNRPLAPWVCPHCGEALEGQFASCWQCGYVIEK
jgi:Putative prokaryotic signal transducing protein